MNGLVVPITIAVEGATDVPVVRRVLEVAGCSVHVVHGRSGKQQINNNIRGYNSAARFAPWLVLKDLDHDAPCPGHLVASILPAPARWMRFRIANRAIETWLLADADRIGEFLNIRQSLVPGAPEELDDPKGTLVALARRSSRRALREDLVPAVGTSGRVGPGYTARIAEFALGPWRPQVARARSTSLDSCITRLTELSAYLRRL